MPFRLTALVTIISGELNDGVERSTQLMAHGMLAQVLIADVAMWKDFKLPMANDHVVRHGHGPQRGI